MKEDAAAKELENLLREALNNTGLESPRGGTPIMQLKTVPLQVQHLPSPAKVPSKAPPSSKSPTKTAKAKKAAAPAVEQSPESGRGLAAKLAPETIRPKPVEKKRSRISRMVMAVMAFVVLGAIVGAMWAREHGHTVPWASAATTTTPTTPTAVATSTSSEGAVGIAVASRPVDGDPNKSATPTVPSKSEPATTPTPAPAPPPTFVAAPVKVVDKAADKPEKAEVKKPEPKHHVAAKAAPPPAPEKAAPAEKAAPPAAPAATPAASVDALLQQQLKGAIP